MAEIAKLGIGFDTTQATQNANNFSVAVKNMNQQIGPVSVSLGQMAGAAVAAKLAFSAITAVTKAVAAEFSTVIKVGMDFQKTMSQVKAVSNATDKQFQQLTKAAKDMGEQTEFSASQAADGLVYLSQAGLKVEQSLSALPVVLDLATAGALALGDASNIVTNIMSGMRLQVTDLTRVADVLANTASSSNINIQGLGIAFSYAASSAAAAGVSIEDTAALMGLLGNAGYEASRAGTALRGAFSKAAVSGRDFFEMLDEVRNSTNQAAAAQKTFGRIAGSGIQAILGQGVDALEKFREANKKAEGAVDRMSSIMRDNLANDLKNLESALEGVRISLFEVFGEDARSAVKMLTEVVRENKLVVLALGEVFSETAGDVANFVKFLGYMTDELSQSIAITTGLSVVLEQLGMTDMANAIKAANELRKATLEEIAAEKELARVTSELNLRRNKLADNGDKNAKINMELAVSTEDLTKKQKEANKAMEEELAYIKNLEQEKDKQVKKTDWLTTYIQEQEQAIQNLGIEQDQTTQTIDTATQAINRQADAMEKISANTEKAAGSTVALAEAQTLLGPGSIVNSGLVGMTFSLPTKTIPHPFAGILPSGNATASATTATTTAANYSSSASPNMSNLLARAEQLQYAFLAEDQLLSELRQKLIETAEDYTKIASDNLEAQLDNLEDQERLIKQIQRLEDSQAQEQLSNLNKQLSLIDQFNEEASAIDVSGLIPVDALDAAAEKFNDLKQQVGLIDFTTITDADTQLLGKFQDTANQYLDAAKEVWKSSSNYTDVKTAVSLEFSNIANAITNNLDKATLSASGFGGAVNILDGEMKSATGEDGGINSLGTSINTIGTTSGNASENADNLATELGRSNTGFSGTASAMASFLANLDKIATGLSAISADSTDGGASSIPDPSEIVTPMPVKTIQSFKVDQIDPTYLTAVWSDGTETKIKSKPIGSDAAVFRASGTKASLWYASGSSTYGTQFGINSDATDISTIKNFTDIYSYDSRLYPANFAVGAWNINGTTPAMLHDGEMVIRQEDSPIVRSILQATGDSSKYGVTPSTSQGSMRMESMTEQMVLLLGEVVAALGGIANRPVTVDVRRVSDALDRFNRTRATA